MRGAARGSGSGVVVEAGSLVVRPRHDVDEPVERPHVPRNHRVEEALTAATAGDMGPFHRLVDVVSRPYDERPALDDHAGPAPEGCARHVTYCGT